MTVKATEILLFSREDSKKSASLIINNIFKQSNTIEQTDRIHKQIRSTIYFFPIILVSYPRPSYWLFSARLVEKTSSRITWQSNNLQLCLVCTCKDSADSDEDKAILLTLTKLISKRVVLKQSDSEGKEAVFKFLFLLVLVDHYIPMSQPKAWWDQQTNYWFGLPTLPQAQQGINTPSHDSKPYNSMQFLIISIPCLFITEEKHLNG